MHGKSVGISRVIAGEIPAGICKEFLIKKTSEENLEKQPSGISDKISKARGIPTDIPRGFQDKSWGESLHKNT